MSVPEPEQKGEGAPSGESITVGIAAQVETSPSQSLQPHSNGVPQVLGADQRQEHVMQLQAPHAKSSASPPVPSPRPVPVLRAPPVSRPSADAASLSLPSEYEPIHSPSASPLPSGRSAEAAAEASSPVSRAMRAAAVASAAAIAVLTGRGATVLRESVSVEQRVSRGAEGLSSPAADSGVGSSRGTPTGTLRPLVGASGAASPVTASEFRGAEKSSHGASVRQGGRAESSLALVGGSVRESLRRVRGLLASKRQRDMETARKLLGQVSGDGRSCLEVVVSVAVGCLLTALSPFLPLCALCLPPAVLSCWPSTPVTLMFSPTWLSWRRRQVRILAHGLCLPDSPSCASRPG